MKTVEKTIDILEAFLKNETEMGIAELAELSKLNISTAYRIASTLVRRGYLYQIHKRGKYFISPKFLEFVNIIRRQMKIGDVAVPHLKKLHQVTEESVNLAILDADEAVCIEQIESSQNLRFSTKLGTRFPLYCTGLGKVFLAYMGEEGMEKYIKSKGLPYRTENTITDHARLKEELAIIRREGITVDNEEFEVGVICIGAPIFDGYGDVIGAFNISGPAARLHGSRLEELKSLVKNCSLEVSEKYKKPVWQPVEPQSKAKNTFPSG